ncbi:hypothetical protein [Marinibactrum halimedae]|uniref:Uncharacterized protein n=1 Tax=Marinibactrum halimedae TaxID=1444977 RepID=A0AA37T8Q9_9GAMM|nr:hypothetical protein [Marinibactrum halimedae]MCD9457998.1 hypothetical protein [Marinibactrum halimedae]GLS27624.1 hypothetical protein GCM10007877_33430 [Marinibactrum halimedae]
MSKSQRITTTMIGLMLTAIITSTLTAVMSGMYSRDSGHFTQSRLHTSTNHSSVNQPPKPTREAVKKDKPVRQLSPPRDSYPNITLSLQGFSIRAF